MRFPEDVTKDALNRLRRAEGQMRGVQRLLEEGADCKPAESDGMSIDQMEELFLTLR